MSAIVTQDQLRNALENAGEGWIFTSWEGDINRYLTHLADDLAKFADRYEERFHERPDPLRLLEEDSLKAHAFFQLDTLRMSTEMKIMVWRVLVVECEIKSIRFEYESEQPPNLAVILIGPTGKAEEHVGQGVWDFTALRHFGPSGVNERGLRFAGYYPLRR